MTLRPHLHAYGGHGYDHLAESCGGDPTCEALWTRGGSLLTFPLARGPALVFLAAATGADRPTEGDSNWGSYQNFHGVSGHTYFSAVPFITAAKMSENPYQKALFYGLSTFAGLSRINDDEHYFSQVALGWYLAYLSCAVVEKGTDRQEGRVHVQLAPVPKGLAITVQKRY